MKIYKLSWFFNKKQPEQQQEYDPTSYTTEQVLENLKKQIDQELMRVGRLGATTKPTGTRGYYNTELHYAFEELYANNPHPDKWVITKEPMGDRINWAVTSKEPN